MVITPQRKQQIDYIKSHKKEVNQEFEIDSVKYTITSFKFLKLLEVDSFLLKVNINLQNISKQQIKIDSKDFYLNTYTNDLNKKFYPKYNLSALLPYQKKQEIIYFIVQKTNSRSIGYTLNIISKNSAKQNALLFFNIDLVR